MAQELEQSCQGQTLIRTKAIFETSRGIEMNTEIMKNNKFTTNMHEHELFVCPHRIFTNDISYYRPRQKYLDNFKDILSILGYLENFMILVTMITFKLLEEIVIAAKIVSQHTHINYRSFKYAQLHGYIPSRVLTSTECSINADK